MTDTGTRADPGTGDSRMEDVKAQAGEQAHKAADQARERARGMVDERSTQAGERISTQASDIRTVAEQLREQGKDQPAKVADQAADRIEKVGSYLTESDGDRILRDVERMARENPWAVVAGGIALGFAASRFLKASSRERYRSSNGRRDRSPTRELPRESAGAIPPVTPATTAAPADTAGVGTGMGATPVGSS